jgi:hypothetical protein
MGANPIINDSKKATQQEFENRSTGNTGQRSALPEDRHLPRKEVASHRQGRSARLVKHEMSRDTGA